jgi:hypothetical protein
MEGLERRKFSNDAPCSWAIAGRDTAETERSMHLAESFIIISFFKKEKKKVMVSP